MAENKVVALNLGPVTSYGLAKNKGFPGTEEAWVEKMIAAVSDKDVEALDKKIDDLDEEVEKQVQMINNTITLEVGAVSAKADGIAKDVTELAGVVTKKMDTSTALSAFVPVPTASGESGDALRNNGDGTTSWAPVGLPTDEQTSLAINTWLSAHPEATTTVQDGAITDVKLSSELSAKVGKVEINEQNIGAIENAVAKSSDIVVLTWEKGNITTTGESSSSRFIRTKDWIIIPPGGMIVVDAFDYETYELKKVLFRSLVEGATGVSTVITENNLVWVNADTSVAYVRFRLYNKVIETTELSEKSVVTVHKNFQNENSDKALGYAKAVANTVGRVEVLQWEQGYRNVSGISPSAASIRTVNAVQVEAGTHITMQHCPDDVTVTMYEYAIDDSTHISARRGEVLSVGVPVYVTLASDLLFRATRSGSGAILLPDEGLQIGIVCEKDVKAPQEPKHLYESPGKHLYEIDMGASHDEVLRVVDGAAVAYRSCPSSYRITCKSTDIFNIVYKGDANTSISAAYLYIYVYNLNGELATDILYKLNSANIINRFYQSELKEMGAGCQITGIPDGYSIVFIQGGGIISVYKWDGEAVNEELNTTPIAYDGTSLIRFPQDGGVGVYVPKDVACIFAKPGYTFLHIGRVFSGPDVRSADAIGSVTLVPAQVLWTHAQDSSRGKIVTVVRNYDYATGQYDKDSSNIDLRGAICVVPSVRNEVLHHAVAHGGGYSAWKTIGEPCINMPWVAQKDLVAANGANYGTFRQGVKYCGIPYGSRWRSASYVGWHVSAHTFVNAANDPDSIFNDTTKSFNGSHAGAYYSNVCSSFGTLFAGFPYPMTNFSFFHNPHVVVHRTRDFELGSLLSNGTGHCITPLKKTSTEISTEPYSYEIVEQVTPVGKRMTCYYDVLSSYSVDNVYGSYGRNYKYQVDYDFKYRTQDPVYDLNEIDITAGTARPNKGDKSVYTNYEDVVINVHASGATKVIVYTCNYSQDTGAITAGEVLYEIPYSAGETCVVDKQRLTSGTVYGVCTDTDSALEYFEYRADADIEYSITDGVLHTNAEFWYCVIAGVDVNDPTDGGLVSVAYESSHDYSEYGKFVQFTSTATFFRKGYLGAYVVGALQSGFEDTED